MIKLNSFVVAFVLLTGVLCARSARPAEPAYAPESTPTQQLVSSHCSYLRPRRIVIVMTENRQDRLQEQDRFAQSLAVQLRANHQFEVVIGRERVCLNKLPMRRGKFDEHDVLAVSREYNADTVLYCDLHHVAAYAPMRLQASMLLVNAGEAISLVSRTSTFDLSNVATLQQYANFAYQQCAESVANAHLYSPTQFIDFAAGEFALGLTTIWSP